MRDRSSPASAARSRVFRPVSATAAAVAGFAIAAGWVALAVEAADGALTPLVRQAPLMLLAGCLAYALLVRPAVEVGPTGVRLRNVVRDVVVPWAALADVRTRYALTLTTTDGRHFTAWAAPAAGRHTDTRLTRREAEALAGELPPASASLESASGAVAAWIDREWLRARTAAAASDPGSPGSHHLGPSTPGDGARAGADPHSGAPGDVAPLNAASTEPARALITFLTAATALSLATLLI